MTYRTRNLKQSCTYWRKTGSDGKGWYTFADPVLLDCRWEDVQEEFMDENGNKQISTAKVFLAEDIVLHGYLALGDYTGSDYDDPKDVSSSAKISAIMKKPNLRGTVIQQTIYLTGR